VRGWRAYFILLVPPTLWLVVFLVAPYLLLLSYSLFSVDEHQRIVRSVSGINYAHLVSNPLYLGTLWKSAEIAFAVTVLAVLLAYPIAYVLAFLVRRHRQLWYMLAIIPLWISYLVRAYAWKTILGTEGILNQALLHAGVIDSPVAAFLYSPLSVIMTLTHIYTPFVVMPLYALLEQVPRAALEAAADLGAGRWRTFWHVILPLSLPGAVAGATFAFVLSLGDFLSPLLVGGPSGIMISNIVVSLFGAAFNWPLGAAVSVVLLISVLVLISAVRLLEERWRYV